MNETLFLHAANVVFLSGLAVSNQLILRILLTIAFVMSSVYFAVLSLWAPIAWNSLFVAINLVGIARSRKQANE